MQHPVELKKSQRKWYGKPDLFAVELKSFDDFFLHQERFFSLYIVILPLQFKYENTPGDGEIVASQLEPKSSLQCGI